MGRVKTMLIVKLLQMLFERNYYLCWADSAGEVCDEYVHEVGESKHANDHGLLIHNIESVHPWWRSAENQKKKKNKKLQTREMWCDVMWLAI